ncbi:transglutaminase-like domain-containing protein [Alteromonas sp. CYL-A6]|uniref:transglutaminase-like domain-containing protein n=1 Tax=Alteromonas nitratireducens TaxID=3390813 RepID=UPI0034BD0CC3
MRALFGWLMLALSGSVSAEGVPFYAQISVSLDSTATRPLASVIEADVIVSDAGKAAGYLTAWPDIVARVTDKQTLHVTLPERAAYAGEATPAYLRSSFVVDTDEPATRAFTDGFPAAADTPPTPDALMAYVDSYIDNPSYIHGFNIASVIATQRSGDCTEYAVLTSALARALGLPARVILGTVIIDSGDGVLAFGHAWSEVQFDGQWHITDSALYRSTGTRHFYLPSGALDNEGPGFGMSLMTLNMLLPARLDGVKSAP